MYSWGLSSPCNLLSRTYSIFCGHWSCDSICREFWWKRWLADRLSISGHKQYLRSFLWYEDGSDAESMTVVASLLLGEKVEVWGIRSGNHEAYRSQPDVHGRINWSKKIIGFRALSLSEDNIRREVPWRIEDALELLWQGQPHKSWAQALSRKWAIC